MTIKQQIINQIKKFNRPVTRKEICKIYLNIDKPMRGYTTWHGNLSESLSNGPRAKGYLLKGENCLYKIARNQYIAKTDLYKYI